MRPQVGQLINNKYRLVRLVGDGGMGSVFEATHEVLGSSVALKFLHPELARRQGLVQRFLQEARVSAKIDSTHVVRVTDVEQTPNGLPFMVMDYLKGRSLQTLYEDNYKAGLRLSYGEALNFAMQMLDGLEAAHEEGIVHRDLKPDNVMIVKGKRGELQLKLLDFGIAKLKINGEMNKGLTRPGVIMGTPEYMAPEQVFSADAVDARADVFSAGVMIYEMLAGRRPVGGDEAHQIAAAYISGNIAKLSDLAPSVPQGLVDVVHRAMAADPKDRIGSVNELRSGIESFAREAGHKSVTSTPPPVGLSSVAGAGGQNGTSAQQNPDRFSIAKSPQESLGGVAVSPVASEVPGPMLADGGETAKVSDPWRGDDIAAISAKLASAQNADGNFGSTVEGQPFFAGSTEAFQPASQEFQQPRPGGTDIGALPNTADFSGTEMARAAYASSPTAPPGVQQVSQPRIPVTPVRRKKRGLSLFGILGIATLFAGVVVGGVYAYEEFGGTSSKSTKTKTVPLPAKTQKETWQPVPTTAELPPPVIPTPLVTQPTIKPTVATPTGTIKPTGTATTTTTNTVPMIPSVLPPGIPTIQIPTGWGIPGMGGPNTQPTATSTSTSTGRPTKPGGPKLEPIKDSGAEVTPSIPNKRVEMPSRPVLRPVRVENASVKPSADKPEADKPSKKPGRTVKPTKTARSSTSPSSDASERNVLKAR